MNIIAKMQAAKAKDDLLIPEVIFADCPNCGQEYKATNPRQVYCARKCAKSAQAARYYKKRTGKQEVKNYKKGGQQNANTQNG